MKNDLTYDKAYAELISILSSLQQEETGLDELSKKLQRAAELTKFCKEKLREIESEVDKLGN
ncbi:MAG: exodeoxyribonuclease VII small subunit [Saprospiraceae bacterium]|nr:exodeoxyribonuclease VII small subunit [Saprospiraceae bacterium]